jgi:iterative type I PKS product template protein
MITSHDLKNRPCAPLPIYALYHAEHLYDMNVIEALLHPIRQREMWKLTESIRIITQNSSSCERSRRPDDLSPRGNLGEALSRALKSILLEQMNIGALVAALGSRLGNGDNTRIHVVPICSGAGSQVQSALESFRCGLHVTLARPNLSSCSSFTLEERQKCKIAVVGSSGRFPGGADTEDAFWELLLEGKDVCRAVPASRWDAFTHVDKSERPRKNTSGTSYGCWLDDAGLFDAKFFGMSPREAEQVDPAQRLALMSTYEALEDGGIVSGQRHSHPSRVGVCFGVTSNDWMETNSAQNIDTYMIPGGNRAFIPGRINYAFKFRGPSYAVDTACSSSLAAIGIACNALWMNEADTMIAGGTNIITNPDFTAGLDRGHFLSRTGNCKTFDDSADGYCRGEGVGVVILKRLDEAVHDGDRIKGVIVDIQTNHSAEAESITRPHAKAQSDLFAKVLGGMSPENISYVEMHGTGTQVGDASEMSSVLSAIAPDRSSQRHSREKPVYVGSVKANVGHGEAVAGVTSLIKLLMMLRHKIIPPHIGIKTRLNQRFPQDMSKRGIRIASEATPWECPENEARYALLNNFSAAGGNTTLILEDPPLVTPGTQVSGLPSTFPITISAKTSSALLANISSLLHLIQEQPSLNLPSLSYTTTARRIHHLYRLGWSVKSISDLESKMTAALLVASTRLPSTPPRKAVFVFTGQGGHYIGMGSGLYRQNSSFKAIVDQFDRLAKLLGFASFLPIIKGGDEENFSRYGAEETQMAHTSLQLALLRIWATMGVKPSAVIGHSLGHYAALNAAGVLSDADTLFAVGTRARILQAHCKPGTHCMLSIHAKRAVVESYITEANSIDVSCINSPQDVVVSGERQHIEDLHKTLEGQQIQNTPLDTQFAFHSSQVDPALNHFKTAIRGITFHRAHIPILYPGAENITKTPLGPEHLVRHMREVVDFSSAMQDAAANGVINDRTSILEIGHNATATSLVRRILGNSAMVKPSLERKKSNCATLTDAATWLYEAGVTIDWEEWHRLYARSLQVLRLPHYNWDLKKYWIPYVNDWSLRKGDPVSGNSRQPSLLSPTIHEVVSDDMDNFPKIVEVRTNLNITHLKAIAYGHKVNGLPLCTPSVYADIALTVGLYVQRKFPEALRKKQISIANMFIMKALVAVPKESQWLQTRVFMDKDYATTCTFSTLNNSGQVITQHAKCEIQYNVAMEHEEMTKHTTETMNAIKAMRNPPIDGTAYRFNTNMIYRMVATLAEFDPAYRGLEEIVLDSENMAATGIVKFCRLPAADYQQKCSAPPTYIDCFTQLAGFVMNANDSSDLEKECFVNHGWGSMTLFTDLTENGVYQCHVRMQKREDVVWKGTLVVVQGEQLVAIFKDIEVCCYQLCRRM